MFDAFSNRGRKGAVGRPSSPQPVACGPLGYSRHFARFCDGHVPRHTGKRDEMVPTAISGLLDLRSPSTVVRFVIAVLVWVSVNAMLLARALTNIGVKQGKGFPSVAYGDAAAAVKFPFFVFLVGASLQHAVPYPVFRAPPTTMLDAASLKTATARCGMAALDVSDLSDCFGTTIADETPVLVASPISSHKTYCDKMCVTLSCFNRIFRFGHSEPLRSV